MLLIPGCVTIPDIPASNRAGEKLWGEPEEVGGESSSAGRLGGQDESHPQWHQQTNPDLQHMPVTHYSMS